MSVDLDQVKAANPIEEVIGAEEELRGSGRWMRGVRHDSLVVDTHRQLYNWNSQNEWGDVIEWVCQRRGWEFRESVEWLCSRAGLAAPQWSEESAQAAVAARRRYDVLTVACRHWIRVLRETPEALAYCMYRGWSEETVREAGLGYCDGDVKALRAELEMHEVDLGSSAARAVLKTPKGMLVYPCVRGGRVVYYMGRAASREEKRHWNPPVELVGERRAYWNHEYGARARAVVVVEGQACAVTLAQWGIPGVALAGTSVGAPLLKALGRHEVVAVGLDEGAEARQVLDALGPMTRLVRWPAHDVNAWLMEGGTTEEAKALLDEAPLWVMLVAERAGQAEGLEREARLKRALGLVARMDDFALAMHRPELVKRLGLKVRQFNALVKAARGEVEAEAGTRAGGEPVIQVEMPGGYIADHVLEMIVVPPDGQGKEARWRTRFACRFPDGAIRVVDHLDVEGVRYRPISAGSRVLTEAVVRFPSAVGELGELRELVRWVQRVIRKYVDVDVFYETLAAYYVLFSWLYDAFNTVPYLRLLGDAGTGKSRFIQVVGAMCYRPMFVTGAATVSPIFRIMDRYQGTLILDEADYRRSDESQDIIKILNTGYQRTQGVVLRSGDKTTGFDTEVFVCYGPKVIATRKRFFDWALESRCLTHETGGPTTRTDIPIDLPRAFWDEETLAVRNALLRYRLEHWRPEIELDYSQMELSVEPRLNQVTVALLTLIDDEDLRGDLRQFIKEYNRQLIIERGMTLTARVLEALVGLWEMDLEMEEVPDTTVKRVAKAVNILIDTENRANGEEEIIEEEKDKPRERSVTARKVGEIARKQLHLRTERRSDQGRAYMVIYEADRVDALRKRFGLDDEWLGEIIGVLKRTMVGQKEMWEEDEPPPGFDLE